MGMRTEGEEKFSCKEGTIILRHSCRWSWDEDENYSIWPSLPLCHTYFNTNHCYLARFSCHATSSCGIILFCKVVLSSACTYDKERSKPYLLRITNHFYLNSSMVEWTLNWVLAFHLRHFPKLLNNNPKRVLKKHNNNI